ncbi:MAG TPA: DUF3300 domain-containing protein [Burkholderiales bacterium]|nr:DUF3300 domain-containing protein [Burkholderiales bacterium]
MRIVLLVVLVSLAGAAQARYGQAELEGLLAPLVAYPEELTAHVLIAASYPEQVAAAARGEPAPPHWHPSVNALTASPEVLQRMAESPQWMQALAWAHVNQQADVLGTLQLLRGRYSPPMPPPAIYASPPIVVEHHYFPAFIPTPVFVSKPHFHGHHFNKHREHRYVERPYRKVPESKRRPIVSSTPPLSKPRETRRPGGFFSRPAFETKRR